MKSNNVLVAVLFVGMASIPAAQAEQPIDKNSSIGTWRLNLSESIAPQGRNFDPYTVVLKSKDGVLNFTYQSTRDGKPYEFAYDAEADGVARDVGGGMKAAMVRLPSGNIEARMWLPDGSFENKFCQLSADGMKNVCLATITQPDGSVVFFKQVMDRQ